MLLTSKSVDKTLVYDHSNESYFKQYFHALLFITLYKVVLIFKSMNKTLSVTIQMKAFEQYFVVLFTMLHKVALTSKSVFQTGLVCNHSNGSYRAVLS